MVQERWGRYAGAGRPRWGLPGSGSSCPTGFSPNPPALPSHRRRPRQLFNHPPTNILAGGPPSPPPLLRVLGWDPEAQHGGVDGRYRWQRG